MLGHTDGRPLACNAPHQSYGIVDLIVSTIPRYREGIGGPKRGKLKRSRKRKQHIRRVYLPCPSVPNLRAGNWCGFFLPIPIRVRGDCVCVVCHFAAQSHNPRSELGIGLFGGPAYMRQLASGAMGYTLTKPSYSRKGLPWDCLKCSFLFLAETLDEVPFFCIKKTEWRRMVLFLPPG